MSTFFWSVLSSVVAALIIFFFRSYFIFLVNILFFKSYPEVNGKYYCYTYGLKESSALLDLFNDKFPSDDSLLKLLESYDHGNKHIFISIKQFVNLVFGEVYFEEDGKKKIIEKITGKVRFDKTLILQSKSREKKDINVYLLNLATGNNLIKGARISLCGDCQDVNPGYVIFKRVGVDF